jgi:hypothetical protein
MRAAVACCTLSQRGVLSDTAGVPWPVRRRCTGFDELDDVGGATNADEVTGLKKRRHDRGLVAGTIVVDSTDDRREDLPVRRVVEVLGGEDLSDFERDVGGHEHGAEHARLCGRVV